MVEKEVEAILFAAGRAVSLDEMCNILQITEPGLIKEAIKDIKKRLDDQESPLTLIEEGDGWKLAVREKYLPYVRKINTHTDLSFPVMETLAVISWKQPILQSDVIRIRSTKAYEHIQELEEKGFITRQRHGRSYIIKVTQKFLDYFDLPDAKAVRELFKDFKDIEPQKKLDETTQENSQETQQEAHQESKSQQETQPRVEIYETTPNEQEQREQGSVDAREGRDHENLAHSEPVTVDGLEVYELDSSNDTSEEQNPEEQNPTQTMPTQQSSSQNISQHPEESINLQDVSNTKEETEETTGGDHEEEDNKALELAKKIIEEDLDDSASQKQIQNETSQDASTDATLQDETLEKDSVLEENVSTTSATPATPAKTSEGHQDSQESQEETEKKSLDHIL
jgi:segregation and condensation protein B